MKYKINYNNEKSIYSTHCEWTKLPSLNIKSIELIVSKKQTIVLGGFEKYLIISTKYKFLNINNEDLIDTVSILGKHKDKVYQLAYHRKGKLFQCINKYPQWRPLVLKPLLNKKFKIEYSNYQDTNVELWRNGESLEKPRVYLKT